MSGVLEPKQKEQANDIWVNMCNDYFYAKIDIDNFLEIIYDQDNDYHKLFDTNQSLCQDFGNTVDIKIIYIFH